VRGTLRIRARYSSGGARVAVPAPRPRATPRATPAAGEHLIVIVPYLDRAKNLGRLIPALHAHLERLDHRVVVVEQAGDGVFNKGRLLNAGFDLHKHEEAYFCFHDVDLLPENADCDYAYPVTPTHVSRYCSQFDYQVPYERIFGGVVLFNRRDFARVNGYSNAYWGWGCEDDDMLRRIAHHGLAAGRRQGRYLSLPHARGWNQEAVPDAYRRNRTRLRKRYSYVHDGLTTLQYQVAAVSQEAGHVRYLIDVGGPPALGRAAPLRPRLGRP
jgi:glycosyl transferase family 7 (putative galactosyltransferase)